MLREKECFLEDELAWTEVIVGIEEGVIFRVVVRVEPGVGESGEFKSVGFIKGIIDPNKGDVFITGDVKPGVCWIEKWSTPQDPLGR